MPGQLYLDMEIESGEYIAIIARTDIRGLVLGVEGGSPREVTKLAEASISKKRVRFGYECEVVDVQQRVLVDGKEIYRSVEDAKSL
jgi:hypothetical protein